MQSQNHTAILNAQAQAQVASAPSMTGAAGSGSANGGSTTTAAPTTTTTTSSVTPATQKKRKKEGLKPIITTEYVHSYLFSLAPS